MSQLPKVGLGSTKLFKLLNQAKQSDANWKAGRTWSLVYHGGEKHTQRLLDVYKMFFAANGLSPAAFPSLGRFEKDVVKIMAGLLGGGKQAVGTMTSGGTESILLAVKAHRDWFRKKNSKMRPQIIIPASAHPAFYKAAHYFDLEPVTVALNSTFRLAPADVANAVTKATALIVASAPSYPYGMVDPIPELGAIARKNKIGLHVDACLGGAFLPFMKKLGHKIPPFDFSVPGVTSISADLHKYGFATKGTSVVLYRDSALRRFQFFAKPDWLGGAYASPAMLGTRPGGGIASAWASLMMLGENGYLQLVKKTLKLRDQLFAGINSAGFEIVGQPHMSVFCFTSRVFDIFSVADKLEKKGWRIDRQKTPPSIHMIVTQNHGQSVSEFIRDLKSIAAEEPKPSVANKKSAAVSLYGVTNKFNGSADPVESLYRAIESVYD
jgi:glutamate/tyrosine decarboxylase-like PLP-dependent enzyme